ncbi:hypothetical protein Phi13:2_gp115 [Cellulophaga phage phi13:2]|uniref:Uncharacterized protein n=1 Tax=Cellulophaga phage phi13:2 TaxID=1328030 RepID=S0A4L5_9CAUD|nr:hypothetical protein Phi13:2_gp115 [Cellulophaga phage phi13:2]AGO49725.1 hypothetical protein Phi13:2_gp115 [Cellulophaga phage phi13:2]
MRNSKSIHALIALAAMSESFGISDARPTSSRREIIRPKKELLIDYKLKDFKDDDGVLKTIEDYKIILSGNSKKGKLKQQRIIDKINSWIESGYLNEQDI